MGSLILLGVPPEQARKLPAHLAAKVVGAARLVREDVDEFLNAAGGGDGKLPLDLYEEKPKRADGRRRKRRRSP